MAALPMHYVLRFTTDVTPDQRKRILSSAETHIEAELSAVFDGLILALTPSEADDFARLPGVLSLTPSLQVEPFTFSSAEVPWGVDRLDQYFFPLDGFYDQPALNDGEDITIYVVDTGVAPHEDFSGRLEPGYSVYETDEDGILLPENYGNSHGTNVAGVAAGATLGVSPLATVVPVKAVFSIASIVLGLEWVAQAHTPGERAVVNMSFGCYITSNCVSYNEQPPALGEHPIEVATQAIIDLGMIAVIAAGNSFIDACNAIPARVADGLTIAATGPEDRLWEYSNAGPCVDMFAPGEAIFTAKGASDTDVVSGTSFAAPHVAGALARIWSTLPNDAPSKITEQLLSIAHRGRIVDLPPSTADVLLSLAAPPPPGFSAPTIEITPQIDYLVDESRAYLAWPAVPGLTDDEIARFRFEFDDLDLPTCVAYTEDTECPLVRGIPVGTHRLNVYEDNPAGTRRLPQVVIDIPASHNEFEYALNLDSISDDASTSDGFLRFDDDLFYATDELAQVQPGCGRYHWYFLDLEAPSEFTLRGGALSFDHAVHVTLSQGQTVETQTAADNWTVRFVSDHRALLDVGRYYLRSSTTCTPRFLASIALDWRVRLLETPQPPALQTITLDQTSAYFAFEPATAGDLTPIDGYRVSCRDTVTDTVITSDGATSPILVTGLTPGNTYQCQMSSGNVVGYGAASVGVELVAGAVPSAPGLSVVADIESVRALVAPAGIEGVTDYHVACGAVEEVTQTPRVVLAPLEAEVEVGCKARVGNGNGFGDWSETVMVTPEALTPSNLLLWIQALEAQQTD